MIKFFRKIRQKLLVESKFSKYFVYAIGEILLVMIGILLALQVNNWNDERKLKNSEKSSLIEINNSLEKDIDELNDGIEFCSKILTKIMILKNHINEKKPYKEQLDSLWIYPAYGYEVKPNRSAFAALENRGIELISNKSLRNKITKHYNVIEQTTINDSKVIQELQIDFLKYYFNLVYPRVDEEYIKGHSLAGASGLLNEVQLPVDYELLLQNPLIIAKLSHRINANILMITNIRELKRTKEVLVSEIKKEIKNLR